jgi:Flp pilus assembly protein TadB
MTGDPIEESAKSVWQSQPSMQEPGDREQMPMDDLKQKMTRLEKKLFWRNTREYIAAVFVIAAYAFYVWKFSAILMQVGSVLVIAGTLFVMVQLHRRGARKFAAAERSMTACIDFYKSELERQRDALRTVWSWYLLPFMPGMSVFFLGTAIKSAGNPVDWRRALASFGVTMGAVILAFGLVVLVNQRAARKVQRQIDELDELRGDDR